MKKEKNEKTGTTSYHCLNDEKEKQLISGLDLNVKNNSDCNNSHNKQSKNKLKQYTKDYFCPKRPDFQCSSELELYFENHNSSFFIISGKVLVPPPESFC